MRTPLTGAAAQLLGASRLMQAARRRVLGAHELFLSTVLCEPGRAKPRKQGWLERVRAVFSLLLEIGIWLMTWVFPFTFMILMACGCATHLRQLGRRALVFYDGEAESMDAAIAAADQRHDEGHERGSILRTAAVFPSLAIPIAFVAVANRVSNTTGLNWVAALGALGRPLTGDQHRSHLKPPPVAGMYRCERRPPCPTHVSRPPRQRLFGVPGLGALSRLGAPAVALTAAADVCRLKPLYAAPVAARQCLSRRGFRELEAVRAKAPHTRIAILDYPWIMPPARRGSGAPDRVVEGRLDVAYVGGIALCDRHPRVAAQGVTIQH